jgi:SecD/SecF fusion protein
MRKEINFNLKLTNMKSNLIIAAIIILAFSSGGCSSKRNYDYKVTVVPKTINSVTATGDVKKAAEILNKRLTYFLNIPQNSIKLYVTKNQISITVSKIDTSLINGIKSLITGYHKLEFWETYENKEVIEYLTRANSLFVKPDVIYDAGSGRLSAKNGVADTGRKETKSERLSVLERSKPVGNDSTGKEFKRQNPLFGILIPRVAANGQPLPSCLIGLAAIKDTANVNNYLKMSDVKALFPGDLKFIWSHNPYKYDNTKSLYELHAIKVTTSNKQAPLDGSVIISAKTTTRQPNSDVIIDLTMDSVGARTWAGITRENINRCIAVVYDGCVRSYPRVMGVISGGNTEITGDFTIKEANEIVNILKSGELPLELKIVEEQIIKTE